VITLVAHMIVLALAWFACINALASLLAALLACEWRHRAATQHAWVFLVIRLLPAGVSLFFVAALFLPAHLLFEPRDAVETLGLALNAMAAAGAALLLRSVWRVIALARASHWILAGSRPYGRGAPHTYLVDALPGVSLAGIVRPRILIGRTVTSQLSQAELEVAIAHERAHRDALDNLARWCMFCAPDFLAGSRVASRLEHRWHVAAESRADATAIRGDHRRAVHLASALIKVARLSAPGARIPVPAWSTLNDSELLEWRVHRLLSGTSVLAPASLPLRVFAAALAISVFLAAPLLIGPVHHLTESLVTFLP